MKKFFIFVLLMISLFIQSTAFAFSSKGVVVYFDNRYIVIQDLNYSSYTVGDFYYSFADNGDVIVGELNTFGMQNLYNLTKNASITVYIDNFGLTRYSAIEWLKEKLNW